MKPIISTKPFPLATIVIDAGTQIRAAISDEVVSQYAEDMSRGDTFPNVVVYWDGNQPIMADGFHRYFAAKRNGVAELTCQVHPGTRSDALRYALSANYSHGLRRSNADKRRSVELSLAEWPKLSDAELARICSVSHTFVSHVRGEVQPATVAGCARIGKDGKRRKMPSAKPAELTPTEISEIREELSRPNRKEEYHEVAPEEANGNDIMNPEPPRVTAGGSLPNADHASGPPTDRFAFAKDFEDVTEACIADANDEQIAAAIGTAELCIKKLRAEQRRRRTTKG